MVSLDALSQRCPNCKLINPPDAIQCDCGYNFVTGEFPAPALRAKEPARGGVGQPWSSAARIVIAFFFVIGGVLGLVRARVAWLAHTTVLARGKKGLNPTLMEPWQAALFFGFVIVLGLTWLGIAIYDLRKEE